MVILEHSFGATYADGRSETTRAGVVAFGEPHGDTAMSRLVGLPAAIAANLVVEGRIRLEGAHTPTLPEIYGPVLDELEEAGIVVDETST